MSARNRWSVIAVLAVCAMTVAACGTTAQKTTVGSKTNGGSKTITIGVVAGSAANPAVQVMNDASKKRAKEMGVKLLVETSENVSDQIEKADALIAQGVNYLALHPWDGAAVVPLIKSARAQGVKVIILIDGVPGVVEDGSALTFISGNESAAAQKIGEWVAKEYSGQVQAAIITGTPGNLSAQTRTNGFKAGIKGASVKVVAEPTANWARDQALRVAGDVLTANPNIRVIFANNDEMAFGALTAVKESKLQHPVDIIGWNGTCVGLKAVLAGDFVLEAVLPFDVIGSSVIDVALDDANGKAVPKQIAPDVPVLTTADAKAILSGSKTASDALVKGLKQASSGTCSQ